MAGEVSSLPLAHLDEVGREHLLIDHLQAVGAGAREFADSFNAGPWGEIAGLWHDLGKYAPSFQAMIRRENGYEAHIEVAANDDQRDHSSAGALYALKVLGSSSLPVSLAIASHHAGLPDAEEFKQRVQRRANRLEVTLAAKPPADLIAARSLPPWPSRSQDREAEMRRLELWTRMLFSALCDADFLDTEKFFRGDASPLKGGWKDIGYLRERLDTHVDQLASRASSGAVNQVRRDVLEACRSSSTGPVGVYTLTVPTGGGKTLAAMSFALRHAEAHGLRRVVCVLPFTAIIEQNAGVYREALGEDAVLEHHSAIDPKRETARNRVASENWDAPVVVTTTVQLFESLFADRPSACRKLHRLAKSVIVLDEAQALPAGMLEPILDALQQLSAEFGTTIVISTATQPALGKSSWLPTGFERTQEIVPAEVKAFERLRRVQVRWPKADERTALTSLCSEIVAESDVLAIVHRRVDARELCEAIDGRVGSRQAIHLSALMCPEHRSKVLGEVRRLKSSGQPVRMVATQLVEAGVDLDFAVVYRAMGGFDSLAQAAGRCNREGKLEMGNLRVFLAESEPPPGVPRTALQVAMGMLREDPALDLFDPTVHRRFFERLYGAKNLDSKGIQEQRSQLNFKTVAQTFQVIEDAYSARLVVPYQGASKAVRELETRGPDRDRMRTIQRYSVNVPRRLRDAWTAKGSARVVADTVVVLDDLLAPAYDERLGLMLDRVGAVDAEALVF